ncbi:MAG: autotransporter domain-containing protein, partial [Candidatus Omnitrophota bacterium]
DANITTTTIGTGTLDLDASLTGTTVNFTGDGLITLLGGKNITGNVDNSSGLDGIGTLTIEAGGDSTISGTVGASNTLKAVNVQSGSGNTATFSDTVSADAVNINGLGTAAFEGNLATALAFGANGIATVASGKTITGSVDNACGADAAGTLRFLGGTQSISGDIGSTNSLYLIDVAAGTTTFSGDINTATLNFSGDGTAIIAAGKSITGDITNALSGKGTLTLSGAHTITGGIGSALLGNDGLKLLTVGNGDVTVSGDIRAVAVNFAGDNDLNISAGYGITGAVTTDTNNTGTLTFLGSTSTGGDIGSLGSSLKEVNFNGATLLSNDIFAANTYVKSGSTVTMTGDVTATGNLTLNNASDAVLDLGEATLTLGGTGVYTQNANSKLMIHLSDDDYGNISATGVASTSATSILDIDVTGLLTGNTFKIIDGAAGAGLNVPVITWDSPLFTITGSASDNDLWINVIRGTDYESAALNRNAAEVGRALDNAPTLGDLATVKGQLDSLSSNEEITEAMDTMYPILDGGQTTVSNDFIDKLVGAAILRLQDSKIEEKEEEKADSQPMEQLIPKNNIWAQFYGDHSDQDARGLSNGYRATIWGTILGIDRLFVDGALRLGLAQGFGFGKIKSKGIYGRTSIDSYQTGFYGEYQGKDKPYVIDAALTYGYNKYDSSRHIDVGNIDRTAKSDYNGQQLSGYIEAGYKFNKNGFDITPLLALDYTYLYLSSYTETGADSLNLSVESQTYNTLQPGIGCRISKVFETNNSLITPELRFRYFYDVIRDQDQTIASFAGGGTSFETVGYKPAPSTFDLGLRLEFFNKKNVTVIADCNTIFKDDYYEVGGSLTFKYSF